jgi:Uma2 family endonuclease
MSTGKAHSMTVAEYERAADEYESTLTDEDVMEGEAQATQREITLASLALLRDRRAEVRVYNELLVQYFHKGKLKQVVPDNMIVLSDRPLVTRKSYTIEYDPPPLVMLEWVSDDSKNKDYKVSFQKYERELAVPFALFFHPDHQDLRVYRHVGDSYELIAPNAAGRQDIPALELEVALLGGWVRYWFRGKLLELPGALQRSVDEVTARAEQAERRAEESEQQARQARERAELAEQQARQARERAELAEQEIVRLRALLATQSGGPPPSK